MADKPSKPATGGREAWSILLIALCVLLALSFFSYDWRDIGLLQVPPNDPPCNFIGPAGAWTAFVLLGALGVGAFLIPVWLLGVGIVLIFHGIAHLRVKIVWALLAMLALASLIELNHAWWGPACQKLNISAPGGLPAQILTRWLAEDVLGAMGAGILMLAVLLASSVMFFGWDAILREMSRLAEFTQLLLEKWRTRQVQKEAELVIPKRYTEKEDWKRKRLERVAKQSPDEAEDDTPAVQTPAPGVIIARPGATPAPARKEKPAPPPPPVAVAPPPQPAPEPPAPKPAPPPPSRKEKPVPPPAPTLRPAPGAYELPPLSLLSDLPPEGDRAMQSDIDTTGRIIQTTLGEFGIAAEVKNVERGPVVTRYELLPAAGVKVESIPRYSGNLAMALKATAVRVQAPIPGKGLVGVEVPNSTSRAVYLREILEGPAWQPDRIDLPLVLGKDVGGNDIVADLAAMPHLLIAGATGSGKTVCMNTILVGLLMARTPDQLRLMLIDPKIVEFSGYNHMPHLLGARCEVIVSAKKVAGGLRWAITEMENRYRIMARAGVRNIKSFNSRPIEKQPDLFGGQEAPEKIPERLPYIVIVIDELADLMAVAQAEIENYIARLAQLSRAVGIHMIIATQRPSVNVITGTIKANLPARIAFQVAQKNDSRIILDVMGADKLLGRGDMLFMPPGSSKLIRAQGALTLDEDIHRVVNFIKKQVPAPPPEEDGEDRPAAPTRAPAAPNGATAPRPAPAPSPAPVAPAGGGEENGFDAMLERGGSSDEDEDTELLEMAVQIIRETHRASTSSLQRRLRIGYTRAARIMDVLEERGIVGPARGSDPREILIDLDGQIPDDAAPSPDNREDT